MIPLGGIVAAAGVAAARRNGSRLPWWGLLGWAAWLLLAVVMPLAPPALLGVLAAAWWVGLGVLLFPWRVVRSVCIPLGWYRAAYFLASSADVTFGKDHRGGGALAAARALLRKRDEAGLAWLTTKLSATRPLGGAGVVALGFLAAARGDVDGARRILASLEDLDRQALPPEALRQAREWRAADAAARGDWTAVVHVGALLGTTSRLTRLLAAVGRWRTGQGPVPSRSGLVLRWLWAPRWRHTWGLVRQTLRAPVGGTAAGPVEPPREDGVDPMTSPLRRALRRHARAVQETAPVPVEQFAVLARSWEAAAEDPALKRHLAERAVLLGAEHGERTLRDVLDRVEQDLARLAAHAQVVLPEEDPDLLGRAARRLRETRLEALELECRHLEERVGATQALPAPDEWREWLGFQDRYQVAFGHAGLASRRVAFARANGPVTSWAVWLWNVRKERVVGNAIFRWLHQEAQAVADERAEELHRRNVACGVV